MNLSRRLLAGALVCFIAAGVAIAHDEQASAAVLIGFGVILVVFA